jgi:hypothetical protein
MKAKAKLEWSNSQEERIKEYILSLGLKDEDITWSGA